MRAQMLLSEEVVKNLIQPISEESPQGKDLREDPVAMETYYDLKELRSTLRNEEEAAFLEDSEGLEANKSWQAIVTATVTILTEQSKDLEVTAWLLEALVHDEGYQGLNQGLTLLKDLIENFQDKLYPTIDEEGEVTRQLPLINLFGKENKGTVLSYINLAPLFINNADIITGWDLYKAKASAPELEKMIALLKQLPEQVLTEAKNRLENSLENITALNLALDDTFSENHIIFSQINTLLKDHLSIFNYLKSEESLDDADGSQETQDQNANDSSRSVAIASIEKAHQYYQNYEPHSPINYLLDRAVRWSNSSLEDIFSEIISHDELRADLARVIGIPFSRNNGTDEGF